GESITRHVDVRVIAATNINIQEALKNGLLREDLYYRLSVIPIEIPPLRDRLDDIVPLVAHFLNKFN
ncbi:MAG: sigma-54-dependent Fis family transcriptional regulator, partial [Ignavibacteriales bacterium CG18_big_fil_WC_8_21_14_2_50_31_20]